MIILSTKNKSKIILICTLAIFAVAGIGYAFFTDHSVSNEVVLSVSGLDTRIGFTYGDEVIVKELKDKDALKLRVYNNSASDIEVVPTLTIEGTGMNFGDGKTVLTLDKQTIKANKLYEYTINDLVLDNPSGKISLNVESNADGFKMDSKGFVEFDLKGGK